MHKLHITFTRIFSSLFIVILVQGCGGSGGSNQSTNSSGQTTNPIAIPKPLNTNLINCEPEGKLSYTAIDVPTNEVQRSSLGLAQQYFRGDSSDVYFQKDIVYGNGVFLTSNAGMISKDGITWQRILSTDNSISNIKNLFFINNQFIALLKGAIAKSNDGLNWSLQSLPFSFEEIAFKNGTYVAVSFIENSFTEPRQLLSSSDNGKTWKSRCTLKIGGSYEPRLVAAGNRFFMGSLSSVDGEIWELNFPTAVNDYVNFEDADMLYSNNQYLSVIKKTHTTSDKIIYKPDQCVVKDPNTTQSRLSCNLVLTSNDGKVWSEKNVGLKGQLGKPIFANGKFFLYEQDGNNASSSVNGDIWNLSQFSNFNSISNVTFGNGLWFARSYLTNSTNPSLSGDILISSNDGILWNNTAHIAQPTNQKDSLVINRINYVGNRHFFSATRLNENTFAQISSSTDGKTYNLIQLGLKAFYSFNINFLNNQFVLLGQEEMLFSSNGKLWNSYSLPQFQAWEIIYGNGKYVIIGTNKNIDDGTAFPTPSSLHIIEDNVFEKKNYHFTDKAIKSLSFGGGLFVAVLKDKNQLSSICTSIDGINWQERLSPQSQAIQKIVYGNGVYVAAGNSIQSSADGIQWQLQKPYDDSIFYNALTFANGMFVLVATNGQIETSSDGIHWAIRRERSTDFRWYLDVNFNGNEFVSLSSDKILVSKDGIAWEEKPNIQQDHWIKQISGNGISMAISSGAIFGSQ